MVLLIVMSAVGVVGLWPGPELQPLVAAARAAAPPSAETQPAPASGAVVDTDTNRLERILVHDRSAAPVDAGFREPTEEERYRFGALIRDLAHDHVRGNAGAAMRRLRRAEAAPLLREALGSNDLQQRQLAAFTLIRIEAAPSRRLATVLVESLRPEVERELGAALGYSSAVAATRYLYHHPKGARPALRRALWSADPQPRFLAAFLLGCDGSTDDIARITRELVGHLAHNRTGGDAMMAAHALYRLGHRVTPVLLGWRPHVDRQARQLIDLILLDLESPPRTRAELEARKRMHSVSGIYFDPVVQYDVTWSAVAKR